MEATTKTTETAIITVAQDSINPAHYIVTDATGRTFVAGIGGGIQNWCSCGAVGTCTHREAAKQEAADVARWEAEAAAREEYEAFGKHL